MIRRLDYNNWTSTNPFLYLQPKILFIFPISAIKLKKKDENIILKEQGERGKHNFYESKVKGNLGKHNFEEQSGGENIILKSRVEGKTSVCRAGWRGKHYFVEQGGEENHKFEEQAGGENH